MERKYTVWRDGEELVGEIWHDPGAAEGKQYIGWPVEPSGVNGIPALMEIDFPISEETPRFGTPQEAKNYIMDLRHTMHDA